MKADNCFSYQALRPLALAVAGAAFSFAAPLVADAAIPNYTFCVRYPNSPVCSEAAAPAPAASAPAASASEQPKERTVAVADAGPPPNRPGECYVKIIQPAEFRDEPMQQLVKPASERLEYTDAVYKEVEEQVLVKPASKKVTVVPAEYGEVQEKVLVREAFRREIEVPALYNTNYERVMVTPARDVWKPGHGKVEMVDPNTGEILCLVHEEATYKTVEHKELMRAAGKRYEDVPAEYTTVKKTVITKPERIEEVAIPAEYKTIKVRKLVQGPEPVKVPVKPVYVTVEKQMMTQPPRAEWTQVLCDVNATPDKIEKVERALNSAGYSVPVNGQIDPELHATVKSFQEQNKLYPSGLMTADTLSKLGVTLN